MPENGDIPDSDAIRNAVKDLRFSFSGKHANQRRDVETESDIERQIEALLFASADPLSVDALRELVSADADVSAALMRLKRLYAGRGVQLVQTAGKWHFRTAEDLSHLFVDQRETPKALSSAALETLAIIAYSQPVTRAEIEEVRGVAVSGGTLSILLETGWVRLKGRRRTPGRPATYGTTEAFLVHFGLDSLQDLPGKGDYLAAGLLSGAVPANFSFDLKEPSSGTNDEACDVADNGGGDFHTDFLGRANKD